MGWPDKMVATALNDPVTKEVRDIFDSQFTPPLFIRHPNRPKLRFVSSAEFQNYVSQVAR
jgi:hypothetical protein